MYGPTINGITLWIKCGSSYVCFDIHFGINAPLKIKLRFKIYSSNILVWVKCYFFEWQVIILWTSVWTVYALRNLYFMNTGCRNHGQFFSKKIVTIFSTDSYFFFIILFYFIIFLIIQETPFYSVRSNLNNEKRNKIRSSSKYFHLWHE